MNDETTRSDKTEYKPRLNLSAKIGGIVAAVLILLLAFWIAMSQRAMTAIEIAEKKQLLERNNATVEMAFAQWAEKQKIIALLIAETNEFQEIMGITHEGRQEGKLKRSIEKAGIFLMGVDAILVSRPSANMNIVVGESKIADDVTNIQNLIQSSPDRQLYCTDSEACYFLTMVPGKADTVLVTITALETFFREIAESDKRQMSIGSKSENRLSQIKIDVPSIGLPPELAVFAAAPTTDSTSAVKDNIRYLTIVGLIGMILAIGTIYLIVLTQTKQIRKITFALSHFREDGIQKLMRRLVVRKNVMFVDEIDDLQRGLLEMAVEIEKNNMTKAQKLEAELRADNQEKLREQKERMLARFARAADHERAHLATELHDDIGQQIVRIRLDASMIRSLSKGREKTLAKLDDILESCNELHAKVRDIIDTLHPHDIDTMGFQCAMDELLKEWRKRLQSTSIEMKLNGDVSTLPTSIKTCLYRCAQEALTNIAKYANPSNVVVSLEVDGGVASITIQDDGVGFNPSVRIPKGRGLKGMKDRVESLSGVYLIRSAPGKGTYIRAHIPVYQETAKETVTQSK